MFFWEVPVGRIGLVQGLFGRTVMQFVLLAVLLVVLVAVRRLRTRGRPGPAHFLASMALLVTVVGVLALTLRPFAWPGTVDPILMLDPVAGAWGWDRIAWGPVINNTALFVPVGALAVAVWWHRPAFVLWLGCVGFSAAIEATQYLIPTGRVANTADILANATGALLGIVLGLALRVRPTTHRQRPAADMTTAPR